MAYHVYLPAVTFLKCLHHSETTMVCRKLYEFVFQAAEDAGKVKIAELKLEPPRQHLWRSYGDLWPVPVLHVLLKDLKAAAHCSPECQCHAQIQIEGNNGKSVILMQNDKYKALATLNSM